MVASSAGQAGNEANEFQTESVGNAGYLNRHSTQMFQEGRSFSGNERDKLWINGGDGAEWLDISDLSGADSAGDGRAVIAADLDDDGDVDLFVHELQRERHRLYRNELGTSGGQFVKVRLEATASHYEAIGATVSAVLPDGRKVAQVLSRGAGFGSCQAPELVFGIGAAESIQLDVRWPGGARQLYGPVDAGARVLLTEGTEDPIAYEARPRPLPDPLPQGLRLELGQPIPSFLARTLRGGDETVDLKALADGKTLYVNLWASYCGPCVKELPDLKALHAAGDIRVAAISVDSPLDIAKATKLFERFEPGFPCYFAGAEVESDQASVSTLVDLERLPIPTTLVVSPDGVLERVIRGPIESAR